MRLKITLTLLVILLGLLVYIFYIDPWSNMEEGPEDNTNVLGPLAAEINYLRIVKTGTGEEIVLSKDDKRWMLEAPHQWPANDFAIERILSQIRFLKEEVSFKVSQLEQAGSSLKDYGLDPPDLTMEFGTAGTGDERFALGIGKATATGNNLYLLSVDGQEIQVVNRNLLDSLLIEEKILRDSKVFEAGIFEVDLWNVHMRNASRTRLAKRDDAWEFETPISTRADSAAVRAFLNRVLALEVSRIEQTESADLSPFGLQNPIARIVIETDQSREVLDIGDAVAESNPRIRFAKREDRSAIFQIGIDFLDTLETAQTKLRDRRILAIDPKTASSVSFLRGESVYLSLLKLENGEWQVQRHDTDQGLESHTGDSQAIAEALEWLGELKAIPDTGFVNDAPAAIELEEYGLNVRQSAIRITTLGQPNLPGEKPLPVTKTIRIGDRTSDRETYIKLEDSEFVYRVYDDALSRIGDEMHLYRDRSIYQTPPGMAVTRLAIAKLPEGVEIFSASGDQFGNSSAAVIATLLQDLRARNFRPRGYAEQVDIMGQSSPWAYKLVAEIQPKDGQAATPLTKDFEISQLTGGPLLLGGSAQDDIVFEFEQIFIDAFTSIVFDRVKRELPATPFDDTAGEISESSGSEIAESETEAAAIP